MSNPTMLYKCPGPHQLHGGNFAYVIIDQDDAEAFKTALADGWHKTTDEAAAKWKAEQASLAANVDENGAPRPLPKKPAKGAAW